MNATNAATSVDEKCHFKHVHAAWAIKDSVCVCVCMGAFGCSVFRTLLSQRSGSAGTALCHTCVCMMQKQFEMSVMCGNESWQQTSSNHLMPELIPGQVQLTTPPPQPWLWNGKPHRCCCGWVVEVPVTGFLWKQPSHEPKGWVTGLCYLQKDILDRQVQDLCTSFLPDK